MEFKFLNSLEKVFIDSDLSGKECNEFSCLKNEPFNFQLAYRTKTKLRSVPVCMRVTTDLDLNLYTVGYVPVLGSNNTTFTEQYKAGLFPDILNPKKLNTEIVDVKSPWAKYYVEANENNYIKVHSSWQSLWFCINENGKCLKPGKYEITIEFFTRFKGEPIDKVSATVNIIDAKLPPQKLMYTNWFHCDCLADTYKVEMFSDKFFEIFENYVKTAAKNGMNMILTPCFTPPLDTGIGLERKKAQLVKITKQNNGYLFDFSLLKKFIDICRKAGIKYFEHSHLYTQWGAEHCPNIYGTVNGKEKLLFGWKTDACDKKYVKFLRQYLTEFNKFIESEKLKGKVLIHISDEPTEKHIPAYTKAKEQIRDLLDGYMLGDALSHYALYESGLVEMPIVSNDKIGDFIGRCDNFWCYYTGLQQGAVSNRFINNSSERNRILCIQMYYNNINGFLHWGYNYYYDIMSNGLFDPRINPQGYGVLPGTSYFVYPGDDGTALQSIRQKVFFEGINDMRALSLVEKLYGKDFTLKLIEKHYGKVDFSTQAENPEKLLALRDEINKLIKNKTKGE